MHLARELGPPIGLADEFDAFAVDITVSVGSHPRGEENAEAGTELLRLPGERRAAYPAGKGDVAEEEIDGQCLAQHAQRREGVVDGVDAIAELVKLTDDDVLDMRIILDDKHRRFLRFARRWLVATSIITFSVRGR